MTMVEIIASINAITFEEIKERIKKIEAYVSWCHLDVTDGIFSKHITWNNPTDLALLDTKLNVEVHLMVEEPEKKIDQWLINPIKRVIVHLEVSKDIDFVIDRCKQADIECGLAICPDTSWDLFIPWAQKINFIEILAVNPGPSGQIMNAEIVDKIVHLRKSFPSCIIEVDGGITPETARTARKAGANILVSAAYIFSHADIPKAIQDLAQEL